MRPTSEFDPREWRRVYDDPHARGQFAVFRRSAEIARECCEPLMHAGDLWLDLGSGTGHLVRALRPRGAQVVGIDQSVAMLGVAGEGAAARVERLPFADGACAGVVAVSLAGCLDDATELYAEIRRVLRPGGHAVITFTNQGSWLLRLNYALARPDGLRFRHYRLRNVRAQLERQGLAVRSSRYYNCVLHAGFFVFPPPAVGHLVERAQLARVSRNFVVVAERTASTDRSGSTAG